MNDMSHGRRERCREGWRQCIERAQERREDSKSRMSVYAHTQIARRDLLVQTITPAVADYFRIVSIRFVNKLESYERLYTRAADLRAHLGIV